MKRSPIKCVLSAMMFLVVSPICILALALGFLVNYLSEDSDLTFKDILQGTWYFITRFPV